MLVTQLTMLNLGGKKGKEESYILDNSVCAAFT